MGIFVDNIFEENRVDVKRVRNMITLNKIVLREEHGLKYRYWSPYWPIIFSINIVNMGSQYRHRHLQIL